jgi:hypothetical protein
MPVLSGIDRMEKAPDVFIPRSRCAPILVIAGEVFKLDGAVMKPLREILRNPVSVAVGLAVVLAIIIGAFYVQHWVAHWMGVGKGPSQDDRFYCLKAVIGDDERKWNAWRQKDSKIRSEYAECIDKRTRRQEGNP